jgi:hypothetical protein
MNLKSLIVSAALSLSAFSSSASAQWSGGSVGVGFGGSYSRTSISGPYGGNTTITNTTLGGGINVGYGSGYGYGYGGGYGGYYGGAVAPSVLPYYGGCAPAYVPYSPFTRGYGNPCYPPAVVVAPVVYGGGCGQAWVR